MTKTVYLIYKYGSEYRGVVFWGYTTTKEKAQEIVIQNNKNKDEYPMFMKEFVLKNYCLDDYKVGDKNDNS